LGYGWTRGRLGWVVGVSDRLALACRCRGCTLQHDGSSEIVTYVDDDVK